MQHSFILALLVCVVSSIVACGQETTVPSGTISPKQYRWMNCLDIVTSSNAVLSMSLLSVTNGIIFVGGNGGVHAYLRSLDVKTGNVIGSLNYSVPVPNGVTETGIFVTGAVEPQTETFITYVLTQYTVSAFSGTAFVPMWTAQVFSGSFYSQPLISGHFLCIQMAGQATCYRTTDGTVEWNGPVNSNGYLQASEDMLVITSTQVSGLNLTSGTTIWSEPCNQSYPNGVPSCSGPTAVANGMIFYRRTALSLFTGSVAWSLDQHTTFGRNMAFSTPMNILVMFNSSSDPTAVVAYDTTNGRHLWTSTIPSTYPNYIRNMYLETDNFKSFVLGGAIDTGFLYITGDLLTGELSGWENVVTPVTLQGFFSAGNAGAIAFASSVLLQYCVIGL